MKFIDNTKRCDYYIKDGDVVYTKLRQRSGLAQIQLVEKFVNSITDSGTMSSSDFAQNFGIPLDGNEIVGTKEISKRWNCNPKTVIRHAKKNEWIINETVTTDERTYYMPITVCNSADSYSSNIGRYAKRKSGL